MYYEHSNIIFLSYVALQYNSAFLVQAVMDLRLIWHYFQLQIVAGGMDSPTTLVEYAQIALVINVCGWLVGEGVGIRYAGY